MPTPRIEIDLKMIRENTRFLVDSFDRKGINLMGITKVMLGSPEVAAVMLDAGVRYIGDSRIENIKKMKESGVQTEFVLVRTPLFSQVDQVVQYADISLNTEMDVVKKLSGEAMERKVNHKVILMVELGDLREGVPPEKLPDMVSKVLQLPGIILAGIGANLGCFGGIVTDHVNMGQLSELARFIEQRFGISLNIITGGSSAAYQWFSQQNETGVINNLRIGEMIFLGRDVSMTYQPIDGLHTDAITLVAEVIESNRKDSVPEGQIATNAFGEKPVFVDRGRINRAILAIGRQDVTIAGLQPIEDVEILGSSSDHTILHTKEKCCQIGDEIRFRLNYGALLRAMTSPFVIKEYL